MNWCQNQYGITYERKTSTYVVSLVDVEVGIHVPLVSTPDGAGHARPRLLDRQDTLDIITLQLLAGDRVDDGGLDAEERQGGTAGLRGCHTTQRGDNVRTRLCLPVGL